MRLTDIIRSECIKVPLEATDKLQAIAELLALLDAEGLVKDSAAVLQAVTEREAVRSTGIGQGFAIPHGKSPHVDELVLAIGKLDEPIDFDSIDKQPVNVIFLLISPSDQTGPHIQALACISRLMTEMGLRKKLNDAKTAQKLQELIEKHVKNSIA